MLVLTRNKYESFVIGRGEMKVVVRVLAILGNTVRLAIDAPRYVEVNRLELHNEKFPDDQIDDSPEAIEFRRAVEREVEKRIGKKQ